MHSISRPARVHIVGRKNSGKTTLVCALVKELQARGLTVATIKHTHHNHELDTPGKDSHQHRVSGAAGVGILSPQMTAAFLPGDRDEAIDRYQQFQVLFHHCDVIIVEGDLQTTAAKVEVWRSVDSSPPYAAEDSTIQAVITDDPLPLAAVHCLCWQRSDVAFIADRLLDITAVSK